MARDKTTSRDVASSAAKLLSSDASDEVRSVAGSALAQRTPEPPTAARQSKPKKSTTPKKAIRSFKAGKDL